METKKPVTKSIKNKNNFTLNDPTKEVYIKHPTNSPVNTKEYFIPAIYGFKKYPKKEKEFYIKQNHITISLYLYDFTGVLPNGGYLKCHIIKINHCRDGSIEGYWLYDGIISSNDFFSQLLKNLEIHK